MAQQTPLRGDAEVLKVLLYVPNLIATACAIACLPFAAFKALTNVLQGYYGARRLAALPMPAAAS
ncbi:hypothetical protein, conserved [Eimeria necatrix]|uniref:Uncharacterized protein n=1 Tax=Eimeria necatrix TaxID=51315 RepID=U6MJM3_9EIME|nr:hypothetical protein, conserved [Eimeria necatrix]CDJ64437.1 hypothetical protein, conserved [Eimeria necatrix]